MALYRKHSIRTLALGTGLLAFLGAAALLRIKAPAPVLASDHLDSPQVAQDRAADIGDVWAFLDPNDNSQVVLVVSTMNFIVSSEHFGMAIFDSNLRYRFEIENTGDAVADAFVDVRYSPGLGRQTGQTATPSPRKPRLRHRSLLLLFRRPTLERRLRPSLPLTR